MPEGQEGRPSKAMQRRPDRGHQRPDGSQWHIGHRVRLPPKDRDQLLQDARAAVQQAADAAGAIRARARMQASRFPNIAAVSRALDCARHTDSAAAAAWADRTGRRMREAISIIERLRAEGRLHPTWATAEAAALLRELTSFRVWDDLVNDAQIAPDQYVEIITTAAIGTLGAPVTQASSPGNAEGVSRIN